MKEWETESDRMTWTAHGLRCHIRRRMPTKHLCGYVAVGADHLLFGKDYSDSICLPDSENMVFDPEKIGVLGALCAKVEKDGSVPIYALFSVHGGVTFSGVLSDMPDDTWWFGFDAAHAGDLSPSPNPMLFFAQFLEGQGPFEEGIYRNMAYMKGETEKLANQLASFANLLDSAGMHNE